MFFPLSIEESLISQYGIFQNRILIIPLAVERAEGWIICLFWD
jgi:hypothetical protein